jgi:predicted DsbA family dithiol-disulfide isomerase
MTEPIKIDVWSDIVCPWCYIGKRNLEAALTEVGQDADAPVVEVEYHSFELSPDTPVDYVGSAVDYLAQHRGVSVEQAKEMHQQVSKVAEGAGLAYRMDIIQHTNSVLAHELLHFAKEHGRQAEVVERLMSGYFIEGRHVGTEDELVAVAGEAGLDTDAAREALRSHRYLEAVRADQKQAAEYGITGVPFFVIDGQYGVSGAQPPAAFAQIARQLWQERAEVASAG